MTQRHPDAPREEPHDELLEPEQLDLVVGGAIATGASAGWTTPTCGDDEQRG